MARTIIILTLIAALVAPAVASAAGNPYRTPQQASRYFEKQVMSHIDSGQWDCFGRNGKGNGLYRSFICYATNTTKDDAHAYLLETRPNGKWKLWVLA